MAQLTITLFTGEEIECRAFTDVDPDVEGIELSMDGERLGSMIGMYLPDENDDDEMDSFINKVENWMIDNNH